MPRPRGPRSNMRERERSEYDQKVLDVRRTARVVSGGRRFGFRVSVVIGNRKGKVGFGVGKGLDVSSAIDKAVHQARKHILEVPITKTKSIPHEAYAKVGAAKVILKPAREGRGMTAGGPVRVVAELAGIKNITGKILSRTPNKLNNARAVMQALRMLKVRSSR